MIIVEYPIIKFNKSNILNKRYHDKTYNYFVESVLVRGPEYMKVFNKSQYNLVEIFYISKSEKNKEKINLGKFIRRSFIYDKIYDLIGTKYENMTDVIEFRYKSGDKKQRFSEKFSEECSKVLEYKKYF